MVTTMAQRRTTPIYRTNIDYEGAEMIIPTEMELKAVLEILAIPISQFNAALATVQAKEAKATKRAEDLLDARMASIGWSYE